MIWKQIVASNVAETGRKAPNLPVHEALGLFSLRPKGRTSFLAEDAMGSRWELGVYRDPRNQHVLQGITRSFLSQHNVKEGDILALSMDASGNWYIEINPPKDLLVVESSVEEEEEEEEEEAESSPEGSESSEGGTERQELNEISMGEEPAVSTEEDVEVSGASSEFEPQADSKEARASLLISKIGGEGENQVEKGGGASGSASGVVEAESDERQAGREEQGPIGLPSDRHIMIWKTLTRSSVSGKNRSHPKLSYRVVSKVFPLEPMEHVQLSTKDVAGVVRNFRVHRSADNKCSLRGITSSFLFDHNVKKDDILAFSKDASGNWYVEINPPKDLLAAGSAKEEGEHVPFERRESSGGDTEMQEAIETTMGDDSPMSTVVAGEDEDGEDVSSESAKSEAKRRNIRGEMENRKLDGSETAPDAVRLQQNSGKMVREEGPEQTLHGSKDAKMRAKHTGNREEGKLDKFSDHKVEGKHLSEDTLGHLTEEQWIGLKARIVGASARTNGTVQLWVEWDDGYKVSFPSYHLCGKGKEHLMMSLIHFYESKTKKR